MSGERCLADGCTSLVRRYSDRYCVAHKGTLKPPRPGLWWPTEEAWAMDTSAQADQGKEAQNVGPDA